MKKEKLSRTEVLVLIVLFLGLILFAGLIQKSEEEIDKYDAIAYNAPNPNDEINIEIALTK